VLDLGAGSGLAGIAAARAGAARVFASDTDPAARVAASLNAAANGVALEASRRATSRPARHLPPTSSSSGDVFYEAALARRVTAFLDRCLAAGLDVLVGDPGRADSALAAPAAARGP
jgi:predicted nicotinamide N-methyase